MSESSQLLLSFFLAELIGTFMLVILGDGSIAAFVLSGKSPDIFTTCFAFGVGAMIATFAAAKVSGAHINPAVSVAMAVDGRLKWSLLPIYVLAQYLGGFLAALLLYLNYYKVINQLEDKATLNLYTAQQTGIIFATHPADGVNVFLCLFDQILGTAVLLFGISAVTDRQNLNLELRHQPLIVSLLIGLVCAAFSLNCGAIFNPARDLSPRLLAWLVGYEGMFSPVGGHYWYVAGLIGPHLGAILGLFGYKFLIGRSLEIKRREELQASTNQVESSKYNRQQLAEEGGKLANDTGITASYAMRPIE